MFSWLSRFRHKEETLIDKVRAIDKTLSDLKDRTTRLKRNRDRMRWYVILGSVAVEGVLLAYAVLYMRVWRNQATLSTMERVNVELFLLETTCQVVRLQGWKDWCKSDVGCLLIIPETLKHDAVRDRKRLADQIREEFKFNEIADILNEKNSPQKPQQALPQHHQPQSAPLANAAPRATQPPKPVPVSPSQPTPVKPRGLTDRVLDMLVGESLTQGFALICTNCYHHNGFVPPSEYNSKKFVCRHCEKLNDNALLSQPTQSAISASVPPKTELKPVEAESTASTSTAPSRNNNKS